VNKAHSFVIIPFYC